MNSGPSASAVLAGPPHLAGETGASPEPALPDQRLLPQHRPRPIPGRPDQDSRDLLPRDRGQPAPSRPPDRPGPNRRRRPGRLSAMRFLGRSEAGLRLVVPRGRATVSEPRHPAWKPSPLSWAGQASLTPRAVTDGIRPLPDSVAQPGSGLREGRRPSSGISAPRRTPCGQARRPRCAWARSSAGSPSRTGAISAESPAGARIGVEKGPGGRGLGLGRRRQGSRRRPSSGASSPAVPVAPRGGSRTGSGGRGFGSAGTVDGFCPVPGRPSSRAIFRPSAPARRAPPSPSPGRPASRLSPLPAVAPLRSAPPPPVAESP